MKDTTAKLLISDSERNADMLYVSGLFVPDPFVVIGLDKTWHGFFSPLEVDRAKKESGLDQLHLDTPWHQKASILGWTGLAGVAATFLHEQSIKKIMVSSDFPLGYAQQLTTYGFEIEAVEGSLFPQRAVKTAREITCLQHAENVARSAMKVAESFLADCCVAGNDSVLRDASTGYRLKSGHLRAKIEAHIITKKATPSHTIVACGREGADPHNVGSGYLRANEPIIVDIFPRMQTTGYWGDMTRTYVRGKASDRVRKMYKAVREAQDIGLDMVKDGVNGADIHQSICRYFEASGFSTHIKRGRQNGFFHGTGHGVGLDIHESPRISRRGQTLEEGHVVTIEPGLYYPGIGGVRLEDLVVVRKDGCDNLTRHPRRLEII